MDHTLAKVVQITERGTQTFQALTPSTTDKGSRNETVLDSRCSPEVLTKQAGSGPESRDENVSVRDRAEMIQGQRTMENLGHFCMSNASSEIFMVKEMPALQSQCCNIIATGQLGNSQMTDVNMSEVESILTTECPSAKISFLQD